MFAVLQKISRHGCAVMTGLTVLCILASPFTVPGGEAENLLQLALYLIMLLAPAVISGSRRVLRLMLGLGAAFLTLKYFCVSGAFELPWGLRFALTVLLLAVEAGVVGWTVFNSVRRDGDEPVFGCIFTYLLLGVAFCDVFILMESGENAAFANLLSRRPPSFAEMLYFSYTTLTTCGYGDILPLAPAARTAAALEMVCGVLFVALFIARVISIRTKPEGKAS